MTPQAFFELTWRTWLAAIFTGVFFGMIVGAAFNFLRGRPRKTSVQTRKGGEYI